MLVLLPSFTVGAAISYGAVALPYYIDPENDSGLVMTEDQATWFSKYLFPAFILFNPHPSQSA